MGLVGSKGPMSTGLIAIPVTNVRSRVAVL